MTDPVLSASFLKLCFKSYLDSSKDDPDSDYLISPLLAPDSILSYFPSTRIMAGTKDPLRDMSFGFLQKLVKLHRDVKLVEYEHFPHGFLNYGIPVVGMTQVPKILEQLVIWIKHGTFRYPMDRLLLNEGLL